MTSACRKHIATLCACLDGELTPRRQQAIEAHLNSCRCCGELAVSVRRTMTLCRAAGRIDVPAAVHRRAIREVRRLLRQQLPGAGVKHEKRPRPSAK